MPRDREEIKIPINTVLMPLYYKDFHCLCGECHDKCCDGDWRIPFDKQDYKKLQKLDAPPELRQQLNMLVRRLDKGEFQNWYAEFNIAAYNNRCPLQNEQGLCSLQLNCGIEALPYVCRIFPRFSRYTVAAKELSLSLGCEGVLKLLWELPEGIDFIEEALPVKDQPNAYVKQDENLLAFFPDIRSLCIDILQNRQLPLTERMILLGIALQKLQAMDWHKPNIESWLWQIQCLLNDNLALQQLTNQIPGNLEMFILQNIRILDCLEKYNQDWGMQIKKALDLQQTKFTIKFTNGRIGIHSVDSKYSLSKYQQAAADFASAFAEQEYFFENVMVSAAWTLEFPNLYNKDKLWHSYVQLCSFYSFLMFAAIAGCGEDKSREQLFHIIVMASRAILHNSKRAASFQDELFQHESSSLAHMAILLRYI